MTAFTPEAVQSYGCCEPTTEGAAAISSGTGSPHSLTSVLCPPHTWPQHFVLHTPLTSAHGLPHSPNLCVIFIFQLNLNKTGKNVFSQERWHCHIRRGLGNHQTGQGDCGDCGFHRKEWVRQGEQV
uniref:Uncharacterized protein n=1 Tax=Pipistrellus kuhlii TaxID=59472 RepID=A0A7J7Y9H2_PIPKU|nr:hypothetical protein mPipKuh1_010305 [Pipistrellus kuhlii]